MNDRLTAELERIRSDKSIQSLDEANVKQGVILPVLNALGWNPFNTNEVRPEYPVSGGNVDYALRLEGRNKVFLEAKRPREDLSKHESQLLEYAFKHGVPQALLTNGLEWWFYRPTAEGDWQERRFCTIELGNGEIPSTVTLLTRFLLKENVASGDAIKDADLHLQILRDFKDIERALPRAWNQIIVGPDEILIDLLDEKVEELCGHKAGRDRITQFLRSISLSQYSKPAPTSPPIIREPRPPRVRVQSTDAFLNKQIVSFTFNHQTYKVTKWIDLLINLAEQVYLLNQIEFHKVVEIQGTKRSYFSQDHGRMVQPRAIGNSGYYAMSKISAKDAVSICRKLLAKFGYSPEDLTIETT